MRSSVSKWLSIPGGSALTSASEISTNLGGAPAWQSTVPSEALAPHPEPCSCGAGRRDRRATLRGSFRCDSRAGVLAPTTGRHGCRAEREDAGQRAPTGEPRITADLSPTRQPTVLRMLRCSSGALQPGQPRRRLASRPARGIRCGRDRGRGGVRVGVHRALAHRCDQAIVDLARSQRLAPLNIHNDTTTDYFNYFTTAQPTSTTDPTATRQPPQS